MHSRQQFIVPADKLAQSRVCLVGCGAVGRKVGEYLANMGLKRITLIDMDVVDTENLHTQGWRASDIGTNKATALGRHYLDMSTAEDPTPMVYSAPFDRSFLGQSDVIFACVDKMDVRLQILDAFLDSRFARLLIDGRMLGLTAKVLTCTKRTADRYRELTSYSDDQAIPGRCTSEGCVFTASVNAGMLVNEFCKFLRGEPTVEQSTFAMADNSMITHDAPCDITELAETLTV